MPIGFIKEIQNKLPSNARLLGIDVGRKTLGLSISNAAQTLATPLHTIKRTKFSADIKEIEAVIKDYEVKAYVLGYPLNMDGSLGPACDMIRSFADELQNYPQIVGIDPWICLWDERLSTVSVEGLVDRFVDKRKTRVQAKDSGLIDKLAAQHILQGALDFIQAAR